ncbi:MAG: T9SS type A sorting domain-containing protein [Chitinophagales bacterium]
MKKLLLLLPLAGISLLGTSQTALRDIKLSRHLQDQPVVTNPNGNHSSNKQPNNSGAAGLGHVLNAQLIGSAGNLLSIIEGSCNQIDVNDSLNTITFVHRNDPTQFPGTNVAQYRFDKSTNRGTSWSTNLGLITNSPLIDNVSVNGRFPEGVIYNPAGNNVADSAYLVYSGTWHDGSNGSWQGSMRGRGKVSGDPNTFDVHIDVVNSGNVAIGGSMCKGAPGTFWRVNEDNNTTFASGANAIVGGIVVEKGVWNTNTNAVDWTEQKLSANFQTFDNSGATYSAATSAQIAFDPTGQYGWASILGDITADADSVYDPIFWKTTDGGQNWTGPIHVDLDGIQGVFDELGTELLNGDPLDRLATCSFESDLAVDVNGNPHLEVIVGNGTQYSIMASGYDVWDITYDANAIQGCNWKGIHLAQIYTLRGDMTNDNPAQSEDNRPLTSRSEDGSKIFFFWNESDLNIVQSSDNSIPNLFGRGIDVSANKMTGLYNFTEGDTLFGGETVNSAGGLFGGAIFPTVSSVALQNGNQFNIPLVLTQVDYNHDPNNGLGSSEQPAAFWYVSNINFPQADFNEQLDQVPPSVTLNGSDTVTILVNTAYTEDSATAFDCTDGVIVPEIQNSPNTSVVGVYNVLYIATDAAGNSDTVVRVVIVGAVPIADFTWSFPQLAYKAAFLDQSQNLPNHWQWSFGDGTGSTAQNPVKTYNKDSVWHVCLTVSNSFGTSQTVCKDVTTTSVGINETEFASSINMYPNPSSGLVQLNFGEVTPDMSIAVYNLIGETIVAPSFYKAGTSNVQLNLSGVANGVYMVKVQTAGGAVTKQLTIQHN